jgi:hypothetical protein
LVGVLNLLKSDAEIEINNLIPFESNLVSLTSTLNDHTLQFKFYSS